MIIPTLFLRDPATQRVIDEVRPGCEWVPKGQGLPTRMYDGIGLFFGSVFGRAPGWYQWSSIDKQDGTRTPHPVPVDKGLSERIRTAIGDAQLMRLGSYELCGPGINGNPEGFESAVLIFIPGLAEVPNVPRTYDTLSDFMASWPHEGIVWHHEDGRMAKLKVSDFPR